MDVILKCEKIVATSFPILTFILNFEMMPSWRKLLKKKKAKLGVRPAANPS